MPYTTRLEKACAEIEAAQEAVQKAQVSYSKGGSVVAVNKANEKLAHAHCRYREVGGGNVADDRYGSR